MCFVWRNIGRMSIRIHRDIEGKMWFGVLEGTTKSNVRFLTPDGVEIYHNFM